MKLSPPLPTRIFSKLGSLLLITVLATALTAAHAAPAAAAAAAPATPPTAEKPHIVFILADDLGAGDISCYDGKIAPTPNIDRLAAGGIRFTRFYSAAPICSPSRCALITGQYPARWNITSFLQSRKGNRECGQADYLDPAAPSLPRILKAAGYTTAHIGKWHLGGGRDVVDPPKFADYGYDLGLGTYESPEPAPALGLKTVPWGNTLEPQQVPRHARTAWMVDRAIEFLTKNKDRPCFINLWPDDVHTPWFPNNKGDGQEARAGASKNNRPNLVAVLTEMDRQIGRLMDAVPDNTLLIFASDNGALPTFKRERSAGLRGSKLSLYEGGIRLPFIARWPGKIPAGRVDSTTILHAVDCLPTLAAIASAPLPAGLAGDGQDRRAALTGTPTDRAQPLFWEYGRNNDSFAFPGPQDRSPNVAMLQGHLKFLINADGTGAELYDLAADPRESTNLANQKPETAASMQAAALAWRQSLPSLPAASAQPSTDPQPNTDPKPNTDPEPASEAQPAAPSKPAAAGK